MRAAIVKALREDPAVAAIVGDRVFGLRTGAGQMRLSEQDTPGAFTADGVLLPSLVVVLGASTTLDDPLGPDSLVVEQRFVVAAAARDYSSAWSAINAARRRLDYHGRADMGALTPIETPEVLAWQRTRVIEVGPEADLEPLGAPHVPAMFGAQVRLA